MLHLLRPISECKKQGFFIIIFKAKFINKSKTPGLAYSAPDSPDWWVGALLPQGWRNRGGGGGGGGGQVGFDLNTELKNIYILVS